MIQVVTVIRRAFVQCLFPKCVIDMRSLISFLPDGVRNVGSIEKLFYYRQQPTGGSATWPRRVASLLYAGPTKSRWWLSFFEGSLVHGEYPVSQVAEAHYGAHDDHYPLSFNLWGFRVPHPANTPAAPANVFHLAWNHYRKAYCALGVSIFFPASMCC